MKLHRKRYSPEFKAKVALEAIKMGRTLNELAAHFGIHHTQVILPSISLSGYARVAGARGLIGGV
jgi:hypothetical protein